MTTEGLARKHTHRFEKVLSDRMDELETKRIASGAKARAATIAPWMDALIDGVDNLLASRDFLKFSGELTPQEQREAVKTLDRWMDAQRIQDSARSAADKLEADLREWFVTVQSLSGAAYGKAWSDFLSTLAFRTRDGKTTADAVESVQVSFTDQDRNNAARVLDPVFSEDARGVLRRVHFEFVRDVRSVARRLLREPRTIPKIREEFRRVARIKRNHRIDGFETTLEMMAWTVCNDALNALADHQWMRFGDG